MADRRPLRTLPLRVGVSPTSRVSTLQARPGATDRKRGRAGVIDRDRVRLRDLWLCQPCKRLGRMTTAGIVDHVLPLWAGGSDDDDNKQVICSQCHDAKTAREARERGGG